MADSQNSGVEIWKPVVGYEGYYEISNLGRLLSLKTGEPRIIGLQKGSPYIEVILRRRPREKPRRTKIHRLVLEAFAGSGIGLDGLHINGDKKNNRLENLYWGTPKENTRDSKRHGTYKSPPAQIGEANFNAVLTGAKVIEIRNRRLAGESYRSIAKDMGATVHAIYCVLKRKTWRHIK